jgi:uncharacterized membrane-anchored protein YhcB (DUF1043 family)
MEIAGPVVAFGAIIFSIVVGIVTVRLATSKIKQHEQRSRVVESTERDHISEDVLSRLNEVDHLTRRLTELEERVDFAERLLARPREDQR